MPTSPRSKTSAPAPPAFTGFGPRALPFFRALAMQQNREWFNENRADYEQHVREPLSALVAALTTELGRRKVPLKGDPKKSIFRLNRDVRFSADKSPYKTHAAAILTRDASKDFQGLLYVHVDPKGSFTAAGFYQPEPDQLRAFRESLRKNPRAFAKVEAALGAEGLAFDEEGSLKRMPRGYDDLAESPIARAIKLRSFVVRRELKASALRSPELVGQIADFAEATLPLLRWGWGVLGR